MKHYGDITKINGHDVEIVDVVCGGKAIWASEIEEFPIAVTKIRFPEENNNELKRENVRDTSTTQGTEELNE